MRAKIQFTVEIENIPEEVLTRLTSVYGKSETINLETSQNILILQDILPIIKGHKTKLVLYTYDAFLFDISKDELELLENICSVFASYDLKYKMKYGYNYYDLSLLTTYV